MPSPNCLRAMPSRPKQVAIPFQDIAEMDAYTCPEFTPETLGRRHVLESQCAMDGVHGAWKLCKDAVAGRVGDSTSMLSNQLFGCSTHRPKSDKCPCFIRLHQA